MTVKTKFLIFLAFVLLAIVAGIGWGVYEMYQDERAVVILTEYAVLQEIEQADPTVYIWLVKETEEAIAIWVQWTPNTDYGDNSDEETRKLQEAALMKFLQAMLSPLVDNYPDKVNYYFITCEPIVINTIEGEGHVLTGRMVWSFNAEAAQAIATGITYEELEILGMLKQLDVQPAQAYSASGIQASDATERERSHVRPW